MLFTVAALFGVHIVGATVVPWNESPKTQKLRLRKLVDPLLETKVFDCNADTVEDFQAAVIVQVGVGYPYTSNEDKHKNATTSSNSSSEVPSLSPSTTTAPSTMAPSTSPSAQLYQEIQIWKQLVETTYNSLTFYTCDAPTFRTIARVHVEELETLDPDTTKLLEFTLLAECHNDYDRCVDLHRSVFSTTPVETENDTTLGILPVDWFPPTWEDLQVSHPHLPFPQGVNDTCHCAHTTGSRLGIGAPTSNQFRLALQETLQGIQEEGFLTRYGGGIQKVMQVDELDCEDEEEDMSLLETHVLLQFNQPLEDTFVMGIRRSKNDNSTTTEDTALFTPTDVAHAFRVVYNQLSLLFCDHPHFRRVLDATVVDVLPQNRQVVLQLEVECRNCHNFEGHNNRTQPWLFSHHTLETLTEEPARHWDLSFLPDTAVLTCACPHHQEQRRRAPSMAEVHQALNDRLRKMKQELEEEEELKEEAFVNVTEAAFNMTANSTTTPDEEPIDFLRWVQQVEDFQCEVPIQRPLTYTNVVVDFGEGANPQDLDAEEKGLLEQTFAQTYNDMTFAGCDGKFRQVAQVQLWILPKKKTTRNATRASTARGRYLLSDMDYNTTNATGYYNATGYANATAAPTTAFTLQTNVTSLPAIEEPLETTTVFRVGVECRRCEREEKETFGLFDSFGRRRLEQGGFLGQSSLMDYEVGLNGNNLMPVTTAMDTCYCPSGMMPQKEFVASPQAFVQSFSSRVRKLAKDKESPLKNVEEVETIEEDPDLCISDFIETDAIVTIDLEEHDDYRNLTLYTDEQVREAFRWAANSLRDDDCAPLVQEAEEVLKWTLDDPVVAASRSVNAGSNPNIRVVLESKVSIASDKYRESDEDQGLQGLIDDNWDEFLVSFWGAAVSAAEADIIRNSAFVVQAAVEADPSDAPSTSSEPSGVPSTAPSPKPTFSPTSAPPTKKPTRNPTPRPNPNPTPTPTTKPPSKAPTTPEPTAQPSPKASDQPTSSPSDGPSPKPTFAPTEALSEQPTAEVSGAPSSSSQPSPEFPSQAPSPEPTVDPTASPTEVPSEVPTPQPSPKPTPQPSQVPSASPSVTASDSPTSTPSASPSAGPSEVASDSPTESPVPSGLPTAMPSTNPSSMPTPQPSMAPTMTARVTQLALVDGNTGDMVPGYMNLMNNAELDLKNLPKSNLQLKAMTMPADVPGVEFLLDNMMLPKAMDPEQEMAMRTMGMGSGMKTGSDKCSLNNLKAGGMPHTLKATPVLTNARGAPFQIQFTVVDSTSESPTMSPSDEPSQVPSQSPSVTASDQPTNVPSTSPSMTPTDIPSMGPSDTPSASPSVTASDQPTHVPSTGPTGAPSQTPSVTASDVPTHVPSSAPSPDAPSQSPSVTASDVPTHVPSVGPTDVPSKSPSVAASNQPTHMPSSGPTDIPSRTPTVTASDMPTHVPSTGPTDLPSETPSVTASDSPTHVPSTGPTDIPSQMPSRGPTDIPSQMPSRGPTGSPSQRPTVTASVHPTHVPSSGPTDLPSEKPTVTASDHPTHVPSVSPSEVPSQIPSTNPTDVPSQVPSISPSDFPSQIPSESPSGTPSTKPSDSPSQTPSKAPSGGPTNVPSTSPSSVPSTSPSTSPSSVPSTSPSWIPSMVPSKTPSDQPSSEPSHQPSTSPSREPSAAPSKAPTKLPTPMPTLGVVIWGMRLVNVDTQSEIGSNFFPTSENIINWSEIDYGLNIIAKHGTGVPDGVDFYINGEFLRTEYAYPHALGGKMNDVLDSPYRDTPELANGSGTITLTIRAQPWVWQDPSADNGIQVMGNDLSIDVQIISATPAPTAAPIWNPNQGATPIP